MGWPILLPVGIAVLVTGWLAFTTGYPGSIAAFAVLAAALFLFFSLTVTVDNRAVTVVYGVGIIRKRISLSQIRSHCPVRNKWYYGWGIRLIPGGLMYNISGLDAVELTLNSGYIFRIGTDEPYKLSDAIGRQVQKSRRPFDV